ncbi:MAG: proton-conducting transporter membrane subunit [Zestosphaera sp.]
MELAGITPLYLMGAAFIVPVLRLVIRDPRFFRAYASLVSLIALMMTSYIAVEVLNEGIVNYWFGGFRPPLGISYTVDALSAVLGLLSMFILTLSIIYSTWMMRSRGEYLFYTFMLTLGAGSLGCLYTGDVFNFFVMLEALSISAYALVSFYRDNPKAVEASIRYAIVGMIATSLYLLAAFIIYGSFGTLNMADVALKSRLPNARVMFSGVVFGNVVFSSAVAVALSMWTFTFKAAIFPNHFWLPDANPEAPTPVSALFVAVIDLIGAYGVIRFLYTVFGDGSVVGVFRSNVLSVLHVLGVLSAIVGALLLVVQRDVKKFIAYSTISHMGLAFMALTVGTREGITAAVLQLTSNSLSEALLFYSAGIAIVASGRAVESLGVLRRYRLASIAFVVGLLNLFGVVPAFVGFWSKVLIFTSLVSSGYLASAVALIVSTGISGVGYVRLIYFLVKSETSPREDERTRRVLVPNIIIALATLALLALGIALITIPDLKTFLEGVGAEVMNFEQYVKAVYGSGI